MNEAVTVDLAQVREECRALVRQRALMSAGAAVLPVPMLDVVVDAGILLDLIPAISQRFGLAPERIEALDETHRQRAWRVIRARGSQLLGIVVTRQLVRSSLQHFAGRIFIIQIAKFVPLGGQMVAAGLGYFVMRQMAYRHVEDCYAVARAARE